MVTISVVSSHGGRVRGSLEGSGVLWGLFCENPNPVLNGSTFSPPSDPTFKYHHLGHQDLKWVCGGYILSVYSINSSLSPGLVRINQYSLELPSPQDWYVGCLWLCDHKGSPEVRFPMKELLSFHLVLWKISAKNSVSPSVVSIKGGIPDVCVCVCVCVCGACQPDSWYDHSRAMRLTVFKSFN